MFYLGSDEEDKTVRNVVKDVRKNRNFMCFLEFEWVIRSTNIYLKKNLQGVPKNIT